MTRSVVLLAALAFGCGTNAPEVPAEWLQQPDPQLVSDPYPPGPYGTGIGDTVENLSFQGLRDPQDPGVRLEPLRFSDFYDPDGERGVELLLVNAAAAWCAACFDEHETLPAYYEQHHGQGVEIVALIFQDAEGRPPDEELLRLWVDAFATPFPIGLDPELRLGAFASLEIAPVNLIVDARDMTLLEVIIGNQQAVLEAFIEGELETRATP